MRSSNALFKFAPVAIVLALTVPSLCQSGAKGRDTSTTDRSKWRRKPSSQLACWLNDPPPKSKKPSFSITDLEVDAIDDTIRAGHQVRVHFRFTNLSKHYVRLSEGTLGALTQIDIRDSLGKQPLDEDARRMITTGDFTGFTMKTGFQCVPPGVSGVMQNATWQYDLKEPGEYTVQIRLVDPASGIEVKSNKVTIKVVP